MGSASLKDRKHLRGLSTGEPIRKIKERLDSGGPLMPVGGPRQREAEAALLMAVGRMLETLAGRGGQPWLGDVVHKVTPLEMGLQLHLQPAAAEVALAELLPRTGPGGLRGVPGLRISSQNRGRIDLVVPSCEGAPLAEVRLYGCGALSFRSQRDLIAEETVEHHWLGSRMVAAELAACTPARPARLLSGVLRRIALWQDAQWPVPHVRHDTVGLSWFEGPSPRAIAEFLTDPHVGVPQVRVSVEGGSPHSPRRVWLSHDADALTAPTSQEAVQEIASGRLRTGTPKTPRPELWDHPGARAHLAHLDMAALLRSLHGDGYPLALVARVTGWPDTRLRAVWDGTAVLDRTEVNDLARRLGIPHDFVGETGGDTEWDVASSRELRAMLRGPE